jgi:hypothetical protein
LSGIIISERGNTNKEVSIMKYDKRNIMKNAWEIKRTANVSMSIAMKSAWAIEKAMVEAEEIGKTSGWNYKVSANDWIRYGKNRTYIQTRLYTNAWNCKKEIKIGYVDNLSGEFVAA